MSMPGRYSLLIAVPLLALAGTVQAASVSYFLDQSNALPDGVNYLQVTISDAVFGMDNEAIRFDVDLLPSLTSIAGSNFGIQSFGFNTLLDPTTVLNAITGLPTGWTKTEASNQDGFGEFELVNSGSGSFRQNPTLTFYISGIAGDSILDYVALSGGNAGEGNVYFASHVAGFLDPGTNATSAYFGGSAVVPVPAAVWLFGSALGLVAAIRRRQKHAA